MKNKLCSLVVAMALFSFLGSSVAYATGPKEPVAPTAQQSKSSPTNTPINGNTSSQPGAVGGTPITENAQRNVETAISKLAEDEKLVFDKILSVAKTSQDISDLSPLTSYLFVEKGFFGVSDPFPKIVNALVQSIFFLTKAVYLLATIVLGAVFKAEVYTSLDSIVGFSGDLFSAFRDTWLLYLLMAVLVMAVGSFLRHRRIPIGYFKFILVMLLALFLYGKSAGAVPETAGKTYRSDYNLSKIVYLIDTASADLTASMLVSFDKLDPGAKLTNENQSSFEQVTTKLFDELVYQPFLNLNFKDTSKVDTDKVTELLATRGDTDKVGTYNNDHKDLSPALSFSEIGHKIFVALASLFKALVVGLSVVILGLLSLIFKLMALLMIVGSPVILFLAMLPGLDHLLGNAAKALIRFVFIGGAGLIFVRGFLYLVTVVEGFVSLMTTAYYWISLLQGVVIYMLYRWRDLFLEIFTTGAVRVSAARDKLQAGLSTTSELLNKTTRYPGVSTLNGDSISDLDFTSRRQIFSRPRTLQRAVTNLAYEGKEKLINAHDQWRYGDEQSVERAFVQQERQRRRQIIDDKLGGLKDTVIGFVSMDNFKNKLHELAGDEDTLVQQRHRERQQRQIERRERANSERQDYIDFQQNREVVDRQEFKKYRRELFEQTYQKQPYFEKPKSYDDLIFDSLDEVSIETSTDYFPLSSANHVFLEGA